MRALLAERRQHLPLWHAYAQQLFRASQAKVVSRPPTKSFGHGTIFGLLSMQTCQ